MRARNRTQMAIAHPLGLRPGSEIRLLEEVSVPLEFERERTFPVGYILEVGASREEGTVELIDQEGQSYSWKVGEVPRYERVSRSFLARVFVAVFFVSFYTSFMLLVSHLTDDEPLTRLDWVLRAIGFLVLGGLVYVVTTSMKRSEPPTVVR